MIGFELQFLYIYFYKEIIENFMKTEVITQIFQRKEVQAVGAFCQRTVESDSAKLGFTAAFLISGYTFRSPILGAIGFCIGGSLLFKNFHSRFTTNSSDADLLDLHFKNLDSKDPNTRAAALEELFAAFDKNPGRQIDIIKAFFKMLDDIELPTDKPGCSEYIAFRAYQKIKKLEDKVKQYEIQKIQVVVDELVKYFKSRGHLDWNNSNENCTILNIITYSFVIAFLANHIDRILDRSLDITQLRESLVDCTKTIPQKDFVVKFNIKHAIDKIDDWSKLLVNTMDFSRVIRNFRYVSLR
ncbi:MAG: hypothetical protein C5B43_01120 [Verrucomicrobia bacterium]|nr:MAG: hypothetical protein C5B43_01120 [Verrucomicrobiota bacterium]